MSDGLAVNGLSVMYKSGSRRLQALKDVSFSIAAGERLAIVGESGSGKSTLGLALMGLLPQNATTSLSSMLVGGDRLDPLDEVACREFRGRTLAMVFQDAQASLDPLRTVGYQIAEPLLSHNIVPKNGTTEEVLRLLRLVDIPSPTLRVRQYPHELSGGMRQRAMVAMALAGRPKVLIADEPTSALDVTTQARVIELIGRLAKASRMATLLITHDLGLVAGFADSVMVLYAGEVVEYGSVEDIYDWPSHPYTQALLRSIPSIQGQRRGLLASIPGSLPDLTVPTLGCIFEARCWLGQGREKCEQLVPPVAAVGRSLVRCHFVDEARVAQPVADFPSDFGTSRRDLVPVGVESAPVLEVRGIEKMFRRQSLHRRQAVVTKAISAVELTVREGESVGIVGESGSGKTTLARMIVGLERPDAGEIVIRDDHGAALRVERLPRYYAQMIFQDPGDSLDPMMRLWDIIVEPLVLREGGSAKKHRERACDLLREVGLPAEFGARRPRELSGGQRQRVAIARALAARPKLIIADEAVASLDMSARGQILNLLSRLQREHGFAYLYISHDLSVVRHICDRVVVLYAGRVVETAPTDELFTGARHPYTRMLISAVPVPDPRAVRGAGLELTEPQGAEVEHFDRSGDVVGAGCLFCARCPTAQERCGRELPELRVVGVGGSPHATACHFSGQSTEQFGCGSPKGTFQAAVGIVPSVQRNV